MNFEQFFSCPYSTRLNVNKSIKIYSFIFLALNLQSAAENKMAASRIAQSGTANRRSTGSKVRNMIVIYKKNNIKKTTKILGDTL